MKKILITGKDSYIGMSLDKWLGTKSYQVSTIDMMGDSWEKMSFSDYDVVFHVAGIAHADVCNVSEKEKIRYYKVNRDLAVKTACKAKAEGVKQFIFMSSMNIYGDDVCVGYKKNITKNTEPKPTSFYGDSKWQADQSIRKLETPLFKVVVLRPPMIYGRGSKGNYPLLSKLAGKLPIFPSFENRRSVLYINHLCEFTKHMIDNEESGVFFPQNQEHINTSNLVKEIAKAKKRKIHLTKCLNPFVWVASKIPGRIGKMANKAFGYSTYDLEMSAYKLKYCLNSFEESIMETESCAENKMDE